MNRVELIEHLAARHQLSKAEAGRILQTLLDAVVAAVKKGPGVTLPGFGSFRPHARAARKAAKAEASRAVAKAPAKKAAAKKSGKG